MKTRIEECFTPGATVSITFKVTNTDKATDLIYELNAPEDQSPVSNHIGLAIDRWALVDPIKTSEVLATTVNALLYSYFQTGDLGVLHSLEHISRMSLQSIWHPLPVPKADVGTNTLMHLLQSHIGVMITPELIESLKDELNGEHND